MSWRRENASERLDVVLRRSLPHSQRCFLAVHPRDPALAAAFAEAGGTSLEALGLVKPPPPPPDHGPTPQHLADSILCAAAEASGTHPGELRPTLLAAFRRARELKLDAGVVERALGGTGAAQRPSSKE